jgi:hypothetical protein
MSLDDDLNRVVENLSAYVDEGRMVDEEEPEEEPVSLSAISLTNFIPLQDMDYEMLVGNLLTVDCSTVPLMRGNNWGSIDLLRVAYALFKPPDRKDVD